MTYNVLCSICIKEGYDSWPERLPHLRDVIDRYDPDLLGLQELSSVFSIVDLMAGDPTYGVVTYAPSLLTFADSTILYRKSRFQLLDSGHFWLGMLPCNTGAEGWVPSMLRYLTWGRFLERGTHFEFVFISVHFDANHTNRQQSAHVVTEWLAPIADTAPIILVGDFNSGPDGIAYATLQGGNGAPMRFENVYDYAAARIVAHNLDGDTDVTGDAGYFRANGPIDHIFVAGPVAIEAGGWWRDTWVYGPRKRPPSDHYAIIAELERTLQQQEGASGGALPQP